MEIPMYSPTSALRSELLHRLAEVNAHSALLEPFEPADRFVMQSSSRAGQGHLIAIE